VGGGLKVVVHLPFLVVWFGKYHLGGPSSVARSFAFAFYDSAGVLHESKGVYFIRLESPGKAIEFRQWWKVR